MNSDPSLVVKEWVLNESFSKIRPFLEQQKLIRPTQHSLAVTCPKSPNCVIEAQCVDDDFFAHCNCHEDVGLISIDRSQLIQFRPDIPKFCAWIKDSLGLEGDIREVEPGLWFLGELGQTSKYLRGYVAWTESLNKAVTLSESIKKQNPRHFVVWFGDTSHTGAIPQNLVSFWDILNTGDQPPQLNLDKFKTLIKALDDGKQEVVSQEKKRQVIFSDTYRHVDIHEPGSDRIAEDFTPAQAQAIQYLYERQGKGLSKCHYKEIIEHVETNAVRMQDVFKVTRNNKTGTHPSFGKLIKNDRKGNYWLDL